MKMRPPRGGMGGMGGMSGEGRMGAPGIGMGGEEAALGRLLTNPKVAETLGLSGEQVKSLQEKMDGVRKEIDALRADLEKASMEQARLLTTQTVDEAAVMAAVEKAGEIRTKIAKLMVQQLLTVKKTLTPEQIEKARAMIRERIGAREQGEGAGPGQWRRPRDRGGRGPEEGRRPEPPAGKAPPPPPEQAL